jgi:hypothetical protein
MALPVKHYRLLAKFCTELRLFYMALPVKHYKLLAKFYTELRLFYMALPVYGAPGNIK